MTKAVEVTDSPTCTRVDLATSQRPFDLADKLWDFACEARPVKGHAFLTWQGRARLTYGKFTSKIKEVAKGEGYDETHFHMHSFRIGGASALAARGVLDHVIKAWDAGSRWLSSHISGCRQEHTTRLLTCCVISSH